MKKSISIVLPAYNEGKVVGKVIEDIQKTLNDSRYRDLYEILVVDDCSSDDTVEAASAKGVEVIKRKINGGSGASRKTGILASGGDIVVMLDADDTYTAEDIPKMLDYFPEYDQVNGARDSEQGTLKFLRLPVKWFIRRLASYLSGVKIPDLNTGLKAFKRDIMLKYMWVIPNGFSCVTTMTLAFLCNGHAVKYVPSKYKKRLGRSKFHPIKDTLKYLQTVIRIITYFNPLKIFGLISFFLLIVALFLLVAYIAGFTTIFFDTIFIVLCATALQALFFGLLAEIVISNKNK